MARGDGRYTPSRCLLAWHAASPLDFDFAAAKRLRSIFLLDLYIDVQSAARIGLEQSSEFIGDDDTWTISADNDDPKLLCGLLLAFSARYLACHAAQKAADAPSAHNTTCGRARSPRFLGDFSTVRSTHPYLRASPRHRRAGPFTDWLRINKHYR